MRSLALLTCLIFGAAQAQPHNPRSSSVECLLSAVDNNIQQIAFPNQPGYQTDDVKLYNLNWPVIPAAITFPTSSEQVACIVQCAAQAGFKVQARGGGHSFGNYGLGGSNGAIVVDLHHLNHFSMDAVTNHATVGAGLLLRELDAHLHRAGGRAIAHGLCPSVGIGGHATVGGVGPSTRLWGTTLDHVVSAEVVLANGTLIHASDTEHPDIFFAIKGAAAAIGIVTSFEMRTEPEPGSAVQYTFTFGRGDTESRAQLLKDWQTLISDPSLPNEFSCSCEISPDSIEIWATFLGTRDEFAASGLPSRIPGASTNNATVTEVTDFQALLTLWATKDALKIITDVRASFYAQSYAIRESEAIPATGIDSLFTYLDTEVPAGQFWFMSTFHVGGKIMEIPNDATAYGHRDVKFWIWPYVINLNGDPISDAAYTFIDGVREVIREAMPALDDTAYVGITDPRLEDGPQAYWGANLARLMRVKRDIDPGDVFHNPQGVRPA